MFRQKAIEFNEVTKIYDGKTVLNQVSLDIEKGEFVVLLGESGSGKTTMLKLINRLIEQDKGEIKIFNENIDDLDPILLRRKIGYVIQQTGLFPHLTVRDNISYVLSLEKKDKAERNQVAEDLIRLIGLDQSYLDRYPDQLSGGEAQRIGVARGFANNPEIILMDEPFGAVDDINRRKLQQELKKLHQSLGRTIVFVTHDIQEALYLGDQICILKEGNLLQKGDVFDLLNHPADPYLIELLGDNAYIAQLSSEQIRAAYTASIE